MSDVFDVDALTQGDESVEAQAPERAYQVYEQSRIAVGRGIGKLWKTRLDAALRAYDAVYDVWNLVYQYYNFDQTRSMQTPRGLFKRGDATENVIYSNINVLLNAVYTKNPEINCATIDKQDEPFCEVLEQVLTTLFQRRDKLNAKSKIRKAAGFASLTDQGVMKLNWTRKDDSREAVVSALQELSSKLASVKGIEEAEELYGQLHALEEKMEVTEPSGPSLTNVLPHNLIVDPMAEMSDGSDAQWMIERVWLPTEGLRAQFAREGEKGEVLIYKPTHQAVFDSAIGEREDGMGLVLKALDASANVPEAHSDEQRLSYIYTYYSECYYVWDRTTRRVLLFHRDDWKWPIWVWDDPLEITQFFPYFVLGFSFVTSGAIGQGEVARYIDQQDEINDINRQVSRIRRIIFNLFFFNTDSVSVEEVTKFRKYLRGENNLPELIGVRAGERKVSEMIEALIPPATQIEAFFNKQPALESINRVSSVNEGLRGVQFKTNTNEAAVNTYQDAMRIAIGAKVDAIEDSVAALAIAVSELAVQHYTQEDVAGLVGERYAQAWKQMTVAEFNAVYNLTITPGSMEKPNSVFKKKEAVQVAQAVGQFAQAAPGATLRVMLRVLEQAFTEVNIKKEDWDAIEQEIQANLRRGDSTGPGGAQQGQGDGEQQAQMQQALANAPPEFKQKIVQAKAQGASDEQIMQMVAQFMKQAGGASANGATNARTRQS